MSPSQWAFYVATVGAVSGENSRYILYHMSYARGLQYQVAWWRVMFNPKLGQNCYRLTPFEEGTKIVV
jgi:hypothetical protein